MSEPTGEQGMKTFGVIWAGQLVSLLGSGLTSFALGIWILQHTSSVTQFTISIVLASLPGTFLAPFAGALVDRWDRRWVLIMSDLGPALATLSIAYLLWTGQLAVWHIYIAVAFTSVFGTFQWPAYIASITLLIKKKHYARADGMLQFGQAGSTIAAPALAGLLITLVDIWGVLLIDFATFLFAVGTLLVVRIPKPPESEESRAARGSLWREATYGWTYIRQRAGLFNLLLFFAAVNLVASMCGVALMPMVLGFASEVGVGTIMSMVGVGMLAGSLIMTFTGGPKRRIYGVLGAAVVISFCFVLVGIKPSLLVVGTGVFFWYLVLPIMNSSSQAIWQSKVQPDLQGRVFAVRRMIAQFTVPIGDFSAGPLADKIFNPLLMAGGALAGSVGQVIGVGPGRGIAFMFLSMAAVPALAAVWGFLNPRVRNVETELPDAVRDDEPEEAAAEPAAAAQDAAEEAGGSVAETPA